MKLQCLLLGLFLFLASSMAEESCDREEMEDTICSLCAQRSGSRLSQLGKMQVAFHTYMSSSVQISSLRVNKTLVYDRVETNIGNGYDVTSGNFVVPENGVYAFHITTVAKDKSHCSVQLVKNDIVKDIGWADAMNHNDRASSSTFTILNVKEGDIVKVRVGTAFAGDILESNQYTRLSFSGFRIV
ncbi:complement C1q-like protein 3 [Saccostrea echinata]|uniref:complement C1q-like protein 3 n=1 Tax=Saccostrea echinata TaxID=191078 RepID=UPI002A80260B|nr:complement C1q-like protein 3 [Saccostrea echinata]